jgi:hypothetical protein
MGAFRSLSEASEFKPFDFTLTTFWGEAAVRAGLASQRRYMLLRNGSPVGLFQGLVQRKFLYKSIRAGSTSGNGIMLLPGFSENIMRSFLLKIFGLERFSDVAVFTPLSLHVPDFVEKFNYTFYIRLTLELDEIFRNMDKKTRNRVRKAEKEGVQVDFADSSKALKNAYDVISLASDGSVYSIPSWSYTVQLHECFKRQGYCSVVALGHRKDSEKVITAAHLIGFDKKLVLWQAGSAEEGYKLNAGSLVQAEIIKWGKTHGYLIYDMGGTNPKESIYSGIHRFKSGFGGSLVTNKLLQKRAFYVPVAARIYRALPRTSLKT